MARTLDPSQDKPYVEIFNGELHRKMSPRSSHSRVQSLLVGIIERCGRHCGMAGTEWDFRVGVVDDTDTLLVPDVAFLTFERLGALEAGDREQPPLAPDVVVEIRSKGETAGYRERKRAKYLACGSRLVLDVDPERRRIDAYDGGEPRVYGVGERFAHPAVPWLQFEVDEAFAGLEYVK